MTDVRTDTTTGRPELRREVDGWGWMLASGVLGVLLGVAALLLPGLAVLGAALALGIGLIVQGALEIGVAVRGGPGTMGRGWLAAFGVLALVAGVLVVFQPGGGVLVLVWGLILWFVLVGVHDLLVAGSQREHRGWNVALGVWSLAVAVVLTIWPSTALATIALFVALGFLLRGGADVGLALSMRRATRTDTRATA